MQSKTVPMSFRMSEEDSVFLAGLQIPGASTPSEKLRALLGEARERHEGVDSAEKAIEAMQRFLAPSQQRFRAHNLATRRDSELLALLFAWLPEAAGRLVSAEDASAARYDELESQAADKAFSLIESILRLGLTSHCRCYDPQAISRRLGNVVELVDLIAARPRESERSSA